MIPDFSETIRRIEADLSGYGWLLRSDIAGPYALAAGRVRYLCNITPRAWYDENGVVSGERIARHASYAVWADTPEQAAFEAYNAAVADGAQTRFAEGAH